MNRLNLRWSRNPAITFPAQPLLTLRSNSKPDPDPVERASEQFLRERAEAEVATRGFMDRLANNDPAGIHDEDGVCHIESQVAPGARVGDASSLPARPTLPPYVQGGKTAGILDTPGGAMPLQSGVAGPAKSMPQGARGFDIVTRTHVEGHAAAAMQQLGLKEATLIINNPQICSSCMQLLPRMLAPGSHLTVVTSNGTATTFTGVPK